MQQAVHSATPVAELSAESRSDFILRTYNHVALSIAAFAAIEIWLFKSEIAWAIAEPMLGNWILVLGAFMLAGWGATHVAHRIESKPMQYLALGAFIVLQAIIFAPMFVLALAYGPDGVIEQAAGVTFAGVAGLSAVAFITRKDFSFLRGLLVWGGILAIIGIVGSILFSLPLGTWFSVAMIGFAGAAVLYDTSNILHHYPQDRHVAAALQLFSSIALMLWYVLRLFMSRD